ncbi:transposase domain-containing protein [Ruminococcus bovis]
MGRKNFLFANTESGATGSAVMYSIIETAKENNLNPFRYLTYIFKSSLILRKMKRLIFYCLGMHQRSAKLKFDTYGNPCENKLAGIF